MINEKELIFITDREIKKLEVVFSSLDFSNVPNDLKNLIFSYYKDLKFFYSKRDYVKSFELVNYLWGYLDCLANLKLVNPDNKIKKWFKIEQD